MNEGINPPLPLERGRRAAAAALFTQGTGGLNARCAIRAGYGSFPIASLRISFSVGDNYWAV